MGALESVAKATHESASKASANCVQTLVAQIDQRVAAVDASTALVESQLQALTELSKRAEHLLKTYQRVQGSKGLSSSSEWDERVLAVQKRAELLNRRILVISRTLKLRQENETEYK